MNYFLLKLIVLNFIENVFIHLQYFKKFNHLKILNSNTPSQNNNNLNEDNIHTPDKNIIFIKVFSKTAKNIYYINYNFIIKDHIQIYINETIQNTFVNTVYINSNDFLYIKLHFPNNFSGLCFNMFYNLQNIIEIKFQKFSGCLNSRSMFANCTSLENLDLSSFDASNVSDMYAIFYNCISLKNLNLLSFNTSKVLDMQYMFRNCRSLENLDLSSFDTSNVNNMNGMFYECISLKNLNILSFNTSKVTNLGWMFGSCISLKSLNLSSLDTSKVNYMNGMFYNCNSLETLDVTNFNTNAVREFNKMFSDCYKLNFLNLSSFDTNSVTYMIICLQIQ